MALVLPLVLMLTPITILVLVFFFIVYYSIYATPYIIVKFNEGIYGALKLSTRLSQEGGYLKFTLTYVLVTLMISPILTLITVNGGLLGVVNASITGGIVGL